MESVKPYSLSELGIDFYDLQCRMMIELIYLFACEMEKNNTKEFPKNASYIFGFYGEIDNNIIHLQNRFILQQHLFHLLFMITANLYWNSIVYTVCYY